MNNAITDPEKEGTRLQLDMALDGFELTELKAVLFLCRRLQKGRKQYGVLNPMDGRNWVREAGEEAADFLVYLSADEQRQAAQAPQLPLAMGNGTGLFPPRPLGSGSPRPLVG